MRVERIGNFAAVTEKLVREIQHGKCYILPELSIRVFHHEPARRELLRVGLSPSNIQFCFGLSNPGHAAIHKVRFEMFGDIGDKDACNGIIPFLSEKERIMWDDLIHGRERKKIEELVFKRRMDYLGVRING